jgi:hypothetical protein
MNKKSQMTKDFQRKAAIAGYADGGRVPRPANGLLSGGLLGTRPDVVEAAVAGQPNPIGADRARQRPAADMSQRDFAGSAPRAPRGMPPADMLRRQGYAGGGEARTMQMKQQGYAGGGKVYGGYADGGLRHMGAGDVQGPGGPREDKVPAMLSDGEYVLPAKTVKAIGGPAQLDQLVRRTNDGREPGPDMVDGAQAMSRGGYVDGATGQWVPEPPQLPGPGSGPTMGQRAAGAAGAAWDGLRGMAGRAAGAAGEAFSAAGERIRPAAAAAGEAFSTGVNTGRAAAGRAMDAGRAAADAVRNVTPAGVGQALGAGARAAAGAAQGAVGAAGDFASGLRRGAGIPQSAAGIDVADATMDDFRRVQAAGSPELRDVQQRAAQARAADPTRLGPGGVGGQPPAGGPPQAGGGTGGGGGSPPNNPPGRVNKLLRGAGALGVMAQAADTFATPTEDYADRLSQVTGVNLRGAVGGEGVQGAVTDTLLRAGGTAYDMANAATFGLADKITGVQRGPVPQAPAAAAPAADASAPLTPTPAAISAAAAPGTVQAQNVAQSGMTAAMNRAVTAPGLVERGNQGLRELARNPNAMAAFNNQQVANQTGIQGEVAGGRVLLSNAPGAAPRGPTVEEADANRQNNIDGMERSIAAMRGLREAREEAVNGGFRFGSTPIPFTGNFLNSRTQALADEMSNRQSMPAGPIPSGLRQQMIADRNNAAAAARQAGGDAAALARQSAADATQRRGQDKQFDLGLRDQGVRLRGQDQQAAVSRYSTDASMRNNDQTTDVQREGLRLADQRAQGAAASAAGQREYDRFTKAAEGAFFTRDADGKQVPDAATSARFMDFVRNSGVPIERLDSQGGFAQARRAFEISERFNAQQRRAFTGRQSNTALAPAGQGDASLTDVANGGLSLRDYFYSKVTNPNVVRDAGGRAALASQIFDGGDSNEDMDLLRQFFALRGQ